MKREALGLIEVYGYLGAIEAADAALKAANVRLMGNELVTGGIVTVKLEGDVAAVQAAVDAAHAAVARLGVEVTSHVIPRPTGETWSIIVPKEAKKEEAPKTEEISKEEELLVEEKNADEAIETIEEKEEAKAENIGAEDTKEKKEVDEDDLLKKTVAELRQLARKLKLPSMTNKQIKFAKKDKLIDEIRNFYNRRDS